MRAPAFFEEVPFATAHALVRELQLGETRWRRGALGPRDWLFRGQGDSRWSLQPSALRAPAAVAEAPGDPGRRFGMMWAEAKALRDFIVAADRAGLAVPGSDVILRSTQDETQNLWDHVEASSDRSQFWPPDHLLEAFALAQHYGIPTRLLDWTVDARAAAYFASREAAKRAAPRRSDRLAIWALARPFYDRVFALSAAHILLQSPSAGNANLRAQSGMFTLDRNPGPKVKDFVPLPLELGLQAEFDGATAAVRKSVARYLPGLIKLTLPVAQAPELLFLMDVGGVNAASLFPGYDGVVTALRERPLQRDPGVAARPRAKR